MKIFIDSANMEEIRLAHSWGIIDGVTTNPSLMAKEGRDVNATLKEICELVQGPVSGEVISTDCKGMLEEAARLVKLDRHIVVKLPLITEGLKALKVLVAQGVKVNVTLCFSANQAMLAAKLGAAYISPFVGRLDDISQDGMDLIRQIKTIYTNYSYKTEILVASIRHPVHVLETALIGADVGTMPFKVIEQIVKHPLTDSGLEKFLKDYRKVYQSDAKESSAKTLAQKY